MPPLVAAWPADTSEPRFVMPSFTYGGYSFWRPSGFAETMTFQRRLAETVAEVTADMTEPEGSLAWNLYRRNIPWMSTSQGSGITTTIDEVPPFPMAIGTDMQPQAMAVFAPSVTMHPGTNASSDIRLTPTSVFHAPQMERITIMPLCAQGRNPSVAALLPYGIAADITLALAAADIAPPQPLADNMLTHPRHLFFGLRCREMLAVWHEPFYILLTLAAWKKAAGESCDARLNNRVAKKPRTEH